MTLKRSDWGKLAARTEWSRFDRVICGGEIGRTSALAPSRGSAALQSGSARWFYDVSKSPGADIPIASSSMIRIHAECRSDGERTEPVGIRRKRTFATEYYRPQAAGYSTRQRAKFASVPAIDQPPCGPLVVSGGIT